MPCQNCLSEHHLKRNCQALCSKCLLYPFNEQHECDLNQMVYQRATYQKLFSQAEHDGRLGECEISDEGKRAIQEAINSKQQLSKDQLKKESVGCFNGLSTAKLLSELVVPSLRLIENERFTPDTIQIEHGSEVNPRNENQLIRYTDFIVSKTDDSELGNLLLGLDEHDFLRVRYRPAIAQRQRNHRSRKVCVRQVLADGNDRIRIRVKRLTGLGTSSSDLQADNFTISESTNLEDIISLINDLETYFQNFVGSDLQTQPSWLKANLESVFRPYDIDGHALLELRRRMPARNMPGIEERIRQFIDAVDYGLNNAGDPVKLDESQVRAVIGLILFETFVVEASLWSRRGRHEGGPGTGKTTVIATAALFLAIELKEKVLLLSNTNQSADNLAVKASDLSRSLEVRPSVVRHYAKHFKIHGAKNEIVNRGLFSHCRRSIQSKAIVVSTLNHAANKAISQQFFATATILDEAGLVTHAEWLVFALRRPRTDYGGRPVVASFGLVGDPNQLRPNISRQNALSELETNKRGLNYSPIEVLANLGVCAQALETSYRGQEDCFNWVFTTFYENRIYATRDDGQINVFDLLPGLEPAQRERFSHTAFVSVEGSEEEKQGTSSANRVNAEFCVDYISRLRQDDHTRQMRIAYICFYAAQKTLATQMLRDAGIENVEVVTADEYQGYEADIVLVDLVRTRAPGFLRGVSKEEADRKFNGRLVVATSRSRQCMLIVGNIFGMSSAGDLWRLFEYYERLQLAFYYDGITMREISVNRRNELIAELNGSPAGQWNRAATTQRGESSGHAARGSRPSGHGGDVRQ